jgi:hypothetical protein
MQPHQSRTRAHARAWHSALRWERLRELLPALGADNEWGTSHIENIVAQDPHAPDARCPRYAGVLEESGDQLVILADTVEQLTYDMGALADAEIPLVSVELVDLDSGERCLACPNTTVTFLPPGVGIFAPAKGRASGSRR